MKLHIGCGSVYLRPNVVDDPDGWVNMDIEGGHMTLAEERPDLVESLSSSDDDYYARHTDKTIERMRMGPSNVIGVCDRYGNILRLPLEEKSVNEILARQMFEHLSLGEARRALIECDRVLVPGGILRIDVPDTDETIAKLKETKDDFYGRHLFGNRKDDYGYHLMGYTRNGLTALCAEYGFVLDGEEPNVHHYPAFCLRFKKKPYGRPPWNYVFERSDMAVEPGWRCLDVGPRNFPWPRADEYLDIDPLWQNASGVAGKPFYIGDVHGPLPFANKQFDFVFCSHVFEHLADPERAARELSRISHRGIVVTPHPFKEVLTLFDEHDHRWFVRKDGDKLIFAPRDEEHVLRLIDRDAQAALCRLFRNGPARLDHDAIVLRQWFYEREPWLDVVHVWRDTLNVEVRS